MHGVSFLLRVSKLSNKNNSKMLGGAALPISALHHKEGTLRRHLVVTPCLIKLKVPISCELVQTAMVSGWSTFLKLSRWILVPTRLVAFHQPMLSMLINLISVSVKEIKKVSLLLVPGRKPNCRFKCQFVMSHEYEIPVVRGPFIRDLRAKCLSENFPSYPSS